jgi:hypothetical protein
MKALRNLPLDGLPDDRMYISGGLAKNDMGMYAAIRPCVASGNEYLFGFSGKRRNACSSEARSPLFASSVNVLSASRKAFIAYSE